MLDVSRIRTGKLSIRPEHFDLAHLVADVIEGFSQQVSEAESTLSFDAPQPVVGTWDQYRIEQVIANLLTNALRYGAKSPIDVRVYIEGNRACVDVLDHGIGISPENQQRIFQQFERVSANHASAGLGLGLYICEQIVAAHGGSISVQSELGQGALFHVSLPLSNNTVS
ncbi:Sensor protein SrrB [compost metagenome]